MRLDIDVEGLWLYVRVGRIIHARLRPCRAQMVQVAGQLAKFGTCVLLLAFVFVLHAGLVVLSQLRAYFFVLQHSRFVIKDVYLPWSPRAEDNSYVRRSRARTCESSSHDSCQGKEISKGGAQDYLLFLDDLGHGMVEFFLSLVVECLDAGMEESSALVPASDALDESAGSDGSFEGPLDFQHAPVLLQIDNCARLLIALFLGLTIKRLNIWVRDTYLSMV